MKYQGKIKADGSIEFLGAPPPGLVLPGATKQRYSEIVPVNLALRAAFRVLRWVFGEEGRVSDWTRRWSCMWKATILLGPSRGRHCTSDDRDLLVYWEQNIWRNN